MYKYKCTSRYKMLLVVEDNIVEIRPQQIIYFAGPVKNKFLKRLYEKKSTPKSKSEVVKDTDITAKELKIETHDGSS